MAEQVRKVDLLRFTFHSLYFCGTQVEILRGERFLTAVNKWYMPFIRSGFAVPLSFIIDVSTLLQRPSVGFKHRWSENIREDVRTLALDYYKMLQKLRRQPIFGSVVHLIETTSSQERRDQAIATFFRFLLAELSHFKNTYAFNTRDMKLLAVRQSEQGLGDIRAQIDGKPIQVKISFADPTRLKGRNEFGTICDIVKDIANYYSANPLHSFISDEEHLMVQMAARSQAGIHRVDYWFLHELLSLADLEDVLPVEPRPRVVQQVVPTDSYEVNGIVGGYIDVSRKRFSGSVAEVMAMELSMVNSRIMLIQRLLNEGALHFVREDIECIEEELRILVCLVVDVEPGMLRSPDNVHPFFGKGMTPYVRAKTLAALLTMDLARYIPRHKVRVDYAVYLWSPGSKRTYHTEFDLFETWPAPTDARDRFEFCSRLSAAVPYLFENQVSREAGEANKAQDTDPSQYLINRSESRVYHCRHMVFLTSQETASKAFPAVDPNLKTHDIAGDSLFTVYCDVNRTTVGVAEPESVSSAAFAFNEAEQGQLSVDRLRARIVETVLAKAAGKSERSEVFESLSGLQ